MLLGRLSIGWLNETACLVEKKNSTQSDGGKLLIGWLKYLPI